jgi:hypothetical protein
LILEVELVGLAAVWLLVRFVRVRALVAMLGWATGGWMRRAAG